MIEIETIISRGLWLAINADKDASNDSTYIVPSGNAVWLGRHGNCHAFAIGLEPLARQDDVDYWTWKAKDIIRLACRALGIDDADCECNVKYDPSDVWSDSVEITVKIATDG